LPVDRRLAALAERLAALSGVRAVAVAGSVAHRGVDDRSDVDLYVHTAAAIPLAARRDIVRRLGGASDADLGLDHFGPGLVEAALACGDIPDDFEADLAAGCGEVVLRPLAPLLAALDACLLRQGFELERRPIPVPAA
jgi:hypothetical protein